MSTTLKPAAAKPAPPQSLFSNWLPSIIAIVVFALVGIAYFFPALKGLVLSQSDITQFKGAIQEMQTFREKYHSEPLWTNSMFGGMPAYPISVNYPSNLVQYLHKVLILWLPFPCGLFFLFCIGFYILLRVLDVNPWLAIVGSLAYGFSSYFFIILAVGHNSKANAISFMAPVLAGVILAFKGKRIQGAVLTALALALELYSDHPQITYYLFMMVLIYGALEFFKALKNKLLPEYFKTLAILGIAAFVAVGTDITNLWLTYDYGKYSTRGKSDLTFNGEDKTSGLTVEYATQWSYGIPETFSLLIPNYQGGGTRALGEDKNAIKDIDPQYQENVANFDQYWGDQSYTSGPVYVGAIMCFFAFFGLFVIKGPLKWFVFFSTMLSVMLSWGHNFQSLTDLFFQYFPGYNKFRSVSMILVIAELAIPLLAVLALDKIFKDKKFLEEKIPVLFGKKEMSGRNIFFGSLIMVGGFTVLAYILPTTFSNMQKTDEVNQKLMEIQEQSGQQLPASEIKQVRENIEAIMPYVVQARTKVFTADAARSSIFILLAALIAWLYMKKIIDWKWFTAVMGVFILADMFPLDKRYLNDANFKSKHPVSQDYLPDEADLQILSDPSLDYRVINTTMDLDKDGMTSYLHKSIGGYSGAKMKRYNELLTYQIDRELRGIYQALQGQLAYLSVLNMLNTKYAIVEVKGGRKVAAPIPGALGNAWFVDNYRKVDNADSEMIALSNFSPGYTAIVDKRFSDYLKVSPSQPHDSTAIIKMTSYEPNDLKYISHSQSQRLAVFSEIYYPEGWHAYIDDQPSDYIQVDYVLRAMVIPSGNHTIEFKFHPSHYYIGEKISLASSLILFGGCIGFLYMQFRKKPDSAQPYKGESNPAK
jgi:Bacterial membrane protein YfhO